MEKEKRIERAYPIAKEEYAEIGVDTERALDRLDRTPVSLHCWQADDVSGCERSDAALSGGGIQATGNYPGKATNLQEIRRDLDKAYSLIPGNHRLNLHAMYGDFGDRRVERDRIEPEHFQSWVDWAGDRNIGVDFNCTLFSHPKADSGYTLSSRDDGIRRFWMEHVKRCREIGSYIGKELGTPCIHNIWIPDGSKDVTVERFLRRRLLKESLDAIFSKKYDSNTLKDSVESKLFGIGMESYTVGSHEFYLGYAIENRLLLCLDIGHFHPTEQVSDKVSAVFQFLDELLFHVTRPVRWDSDHVVTLNDEVRALMQEIVWADKLDNAHIGLDFFDAGINRIGAYVIGTRATQKALLLALLDPVEKMRQYEKDGRKFELLALMEEAKSKPFGAVWDYYCLKKNVPVAEAVIAEIQNYEDAVLNKRSS
ncbi:MAG: L-rhamnose isomerase [Acidobacteria bacterium]|nr:L-rhamnose isomerase [Acidobacteriota bacterium]